MGSKKEKGRCVLVKLFRDYPEKEIYHGTLKGAKKRIPPSKKDQFEIRFV